MPFGSANLQGPSQDGGSIYVEFDRVLCVRFKRPDAMVIHAVE